MPRRSHHRRYLKEHLGELLSEGVFCNVSKIAEKVVSASSRGGDFPAFFAASRSQHLGVRHSRKPQHLWIMIHISQRPRRYTLLSRSDKKTQELRLCAERKANASRDNNHFNEPRGSSRDDHRCRRDPRCPASLEELSPGRTQGKGLHAVTLVLSVAAGILDEELFGGGFAARREISWVEADEEGIGFDLHS